MDDNGAIYLGVPDPSVEGMPADVIGMDKDEAKTAVENASNNKIEVILEPRFSAKKDFGKIVASNYIFGAPFEASNEEMIIKYCNRYVCTTVWEPTTLKMW